MTYSINLSKEAQSLDNPISIRLNSNKPLLANDQMEKLKGLLVSNQSVFSMFKFDVGLTNLVQHKIDTKDGKPVKIPPRRVSLAPSILGSVYESLTVISFNFL
jgi:hypothetical protein